MCTNGKLYSVVTPCGLYVNRTGYFSSLPIHISLFFKDGKPSRTQVCRGVSCLQDMQSGGTVASGSISERVKCLESELTDVNRAFTLGEALRFYGKCNSGRLTISGMVAIKAKTINKHEHFVREWWAR